MAAPGLSIAYTSFTPQGLPDGSSRGNDELSIYQYDGLQRLNTLTHIFPGAGASANVQWQLARNPGGQIATTTRINDAYAWTGSYTVNRAYTTNGLNQYSQAGTPTFDYDANGNLTRDGDLSQNGTAYVYDIENRMVGVSGAHSATLTYDPLGRLWQVTAPVAGGGTATTRFLYDGDALVVEYDGSGNMTRRYAHWVGADVPIVAYTGAGLTQPSYLHPDQQGSIAALSNTSGIVTAIDTYDEYGIPGASNTGRFQYTGQAWLAELGLYYYKARMYSPTLGRFMQTDPVGYADQYNLYEYVGDNPVNATDPSGTQSVVWSAPWRSLDPETRAETVEVAGAVAALIEVVVTEGGALAGPAEGTEAAAEGAAAAIRASARAERMMANAANGARREREVAAALARENPSARIQGQSMLRNSRGEIVRDPRTGQARRVDHVVLQEGRASTVETTSPSASKASQLAREQRIRNAGGDHVRDRATGQLCQVSDISGVRRCP